MVVEDSPYGTKVTASNEEDDESFRYSFAILLRFFCDSCWGFSASLGNDWEIEGFFDDRPLSGIFFKDCWGSLINHWKLERFYPSSFFFLFDVRALLKLVEDGRILFRLSLEILARCGD